jgi:hypothetical protein
MPSSTTSQRRIAANRGNAQHSTGPKSAIGKAASARNSRKFGLSIPLDLSASDPRLSAITKLLEGEGYGISAAHEIALCVMELDRVSKAFRQSAIEIEQPALSDLEILDKSFKTDMEYGFDSASHVIARMEMLHRIGFENPSDAEIAGIIQKIRMQSENSALKRHASLLRYLKRAAAQLNKAIRRGVG